MKIAPDGTSTALGISARYLTSVGGNAVLLDTNAGLLKISATGEQRIIVKFQGSHPGQRDVRSDLQSESDDMVSDAHGSAYLRWGRIPNIRIERLSGDGLLKKYFTGDIGGPLNNFGVHAMAVDGKGSIYVGGLSGELKRISPDGKVDLFTANAGLGNIGYLAIDHEDNLYAPSIAGLVRIDRGGVVHSFDITHDDARDERIARCVWRAYTFDEDDAFLFVDGCLNAVRRLTRNGVLSTIVSSDLPDVRSAEPEVAAAAREAALNSEPDSQ